MSLGSELTNQTGLANAWLTRHEHRPPTGGCHLLERFGERRAGGAAIDEDRRPVWLHSTWKRRAQGDRQRRAAGAARRLRPPGQTAIRRPRQPFRLLQDVGLQILECLSRLQTELCSQFNSRALVGVECISLPTAAIEGDHQKSAKPS